MSERTRSLPLRALVVAATSAAVVAALAGCSTTDGTARAATGEAAPPSATDSAASATASAPPTTSTTSSPASYRVARCTTQHLTGALGTSEGAAGSTIVPLVLENTGSSPCSLQGWPGVSFVDAGGHQIGAAAVLDRASAHQTVTLLPHGHAQALLRIAQAQDYDASSCRPETTTRLRVYPPGSTTSILVRITATTACRSTTDRVLTTQSFTPTS